MISKARPKPRRTQHGIRAVIGGICRDKALLVADLDKPKGRILAFNEPTSGGGATNVAIGHSRLSDRRIVLIANTGNDDDGQALRTEMATEGIEMPVLPVEKTPTSTSLILNDSESGEAKILSFAGARTHHLPMDLIEQVVRDAEALCLVAHAVNSEIPEILDIAARSRTPVFIGWGGMQIYALDYEEVEAMLLGPVELGILNEFEAKHLTKETEVSAQLEGLQFGGRVRTAVVTSTEGIAALRDGQFYHVPAYTDSRPVVDTTGAGDAAQAALVDGLCRGLPLEVALLAATRQGFESCTAVGATTALLDGAAMHEYLAQAAMHYA